MLSTDVQGCPRVSRSLENMTTIGVCGRKGGSGKTTTAVHLAAELASRGERVVLIDCDPQGSANHWSKPGQLPMPVHHLPLTDAKGIGAWSRTINGLGMDFVVLDSAPHLDTGMGATVGISDVVVLPCGPSGLDLLALGETIGVVQQIRTARGDGKPHITLVPNRIDTRTAAGRQLEGALKGFGEDVAPALHLRMALADAFNLGAWVGSYAPGSPAHAEVKALTDHVLKLAGQKPGKKRA